MGWLKSNYFYLLFLLLIFFFDSLTNIVAANADSLKFFGHAFVQIKTIDGKNIYIDPFNVNAFTDSADVVLITHEHNDHNEIYRIKQKKSCTVIRAADAIKNGVYQSFSVGNISIKGVAAYNSNHPKSSSVGYIIEFDGIKLYHSGDTGQISEMADLASENLTYALLTMDGIYTMTPEQATSAAAVINAKYDIPIHTMPPPDTYKNSIVARFTSPNKLIVKHGETIVLSNAATSVNEMETLPSSINLLQNYPNPFNPETTIGYQLPVSSQVKLEVYDALGRKLNILVDKEQNAGYHEVKFDGSNLSSGIYFYRITAGKYVQTNKMILLK